MDLYLNEPTKQQRTALNPQNPYRLTAPALQRTVSGLQRPIGTRTLAEMGLSRKRAAPQPTTVKSENKVDTLTPLSFGSLAMPSPISFPDSTAHALTVLKRCSAITPVTEASLSQKSPANVVHTVAPFAKKLRLLVNDSKVTSAKWSPDGKDILFPNPKVLARELVKYFGKSKVESFVRQLHFYGFKKTDGKRDSNWVYTHPNFTRYGKDSYKVRRKTAGSEEQVSKIQNKVTNLEQSLAITQRRLVEMANALSVILKERNGFTLPSTYPLPMPDTPLAFDDFSVPLKRSRPGASVMSP